MILSFDEHKDEGIKTFVIVSLIVHVVLLIILYVYKGEELKNTISIKSENLKLIESSVRVDVVAMPKYTIKELKAMQKDLAAPAPSSGAAEKSNAPKDNRNVIEYKKEAKKKSFADMMKNLSQKKVKKKKTNNKNLFESSSSKKNSNKLSGKSNKELNNLIIQGNKISKGSSLTGNAGVSNDGEFSSYVITLRDQVKIHWSLPSYLLGQNLKCRVRVYVSANGKLLKAEVHESSGVSEYDNKAIEAVKRASPFAPLEGDLKRRGVRGEILLGFPL